MNHVVSRQSPGRTLSDLPGPKGLLLLGNMLQLDLKHLHLTLEQWSDVHGPLYKFKIANKRVVAVSDPDLMNEILRQRPETYRRLRNIEPVFKEMGINGVFSAEGDHWKRQRRLTNQALNAAHLRNFFTTLVAITERLKKRWERMSKYGEAIDIQKDLMRYTVDITTCLTFGYDGNTLEEEGDVIQQHLEKIFPKINQRINMPFPYWHFFKRPADHALDHALKAIRQTIEKIIADCQARMAQNPDLAIHPRNFLEAMLAARETEDSGFTDDDIFGNILTMLLAGEDTTSNTMAWMIYFMTEYPDIQKRMQKECDVLLGSASMLSKIEEAVALPYIEAVAHEALRLKSVAPLLAMETMEEVELKGHWMPAGTPLFLLTRQGALQDESFTAASQFQPERWLPAHAPINQAHNKNAFLPFGAGPRFCPGRNLALLETKTVMAMLCRNFHITKAKGSVEVKEQFAFTMNPSKLYIHFNSRV
ncbi:MAG: cytochrome P450 [bacterium]